MPQGSSRAVRRYNRRVLVFMSGYVVLLAGAEKLLGSQTAPTLVQDGIALLPAVPLLAVFWAIGRFLVEERDEYQRDRFVRQILWATGATLSVTTIWGFLEGVNGVPHFPPFYTAVIWFLALGIGALVNRWSGR